MADELNESELADATHVRVLETNLLHASDVIYWLDGSSGNAVSDMSRIELPLLISFSEKPKSIQFLHGIGKTAFWQQPTQPMHNGSTTDAQRARPVQPAFDVAGSAMDVSRRFLPTQFDVSLGSGDGHGVVLFPSPLGVQNCAGGIVQGRVLKVLDSTPLVWGIVTIVVTVAVGETVTFRGQTDGKGDFRIALKRLPPLPLNTSEYAATVSIKGALNATVDAPINPDDLPALNIESASQVGSFSQQVAVTIRPGLQQRINSMSKLFIAIQAV